MSGGFGQGSAEMFFRFLTNRSPAAQFKFQAGDLFHGGQHAQRGGGDFGSDTGAFDDADERAFVWLGRGDCDTQKCH